MAVNRSAVPLHEFTRRVVELALSPSANMHRGAELEEGFGHFAAQPGATPGYQDALAFHKVVAEHQFGNIHASPFPFCTA